MVTAGCKKEPALHPPDFDLTSRAVTFAAGKEGKFGFEGTAGIISFYSGEKGFEYVAPGHLTPENKSVAVKGNSDSRLAQFTYTYAAKGTYKAYFVAKNASIYGTKEVVRSVDVTVTE